MGITADYRLIKHVGLVTDYPAEIVPEEFWTGGVGFQFQDGTTARVDGYARYAAGLMPAGKVPIYCAPISWDDINWWLWFTESEVWVTDGTTHYDLTPTAGLVPCDPGDWSYDVLGGIPVFNNPNNPPMFWNLNTITKAAVLPGWPDGAKCKSLRALKYHLVALGVTDGGVYYPNLLWWSSAAQPGAVPPEWVPTITNDAGDTIISDSPGAIVDACSLRDQLVIYKNSSCYTMQYVAGQYVFAFRKLFGTIGIQSLNCAVEIDGSNYVFTGEDVIRHDGQNSESMVDRKVLKLFIDLLDVSRLQLCCLAAQVVERQLWVCIPVAGTQYLGLAILINTDDGAIGARTLPAVGSVTRGTINPAGAITQATWEGNPDTWQTTSIIWAQSYYSANNDSLMMTQPNANLLQAVGIGTSADGEPIPTSMQRMSLRLGEGINRSVVTQVIPQFEGGTGDTVTVRIGMQRFFNDPVTWQAPQTYTIGTTRAINQIVDGRYLSVWFQINSAQAWRFHGYYLKTTESGQY